MSTQTYCVTVVADIGFVSPPSDDLVASHLSRLVELVTEAVDGLSTRVVSGVTVTYCGGGAVTRAGEAGASEG
jgi:hypothetical protein